MDKDNEDSGDMVSVAEVVERTWAVVAQDLDPEFSAMVKKLLWKEIDKGDKEFKHACEVEGYVTGFVEAAVDHAEAKADAAILKIKNKK